MREFIRVAVVATATACCPLLVGVGASAMAQTATPEANAASKDVSLSQQQIDGVVAAQKQIKAIDEKIPQNQGDKADPKVDAQLEAVAKKNGFSNLANFSDVSSTIGSVMAGIDPDTKKYVGPAAVLKKQIDEVQADKSVPAKEKKEQVSELNEAMKSVSSDKPSQANIDLVSANYDKLTQSMQQDQQ